MTNSLERIFDGVIEALQSSVIPSIEDESARSQAFGVLDMLRNLKPRVEWALGPLQDDVVQQLALLARLAALTDRLAPPPPAAPSDTGLPSRPRAGAGARCSKRRALPCWTGSAAAGRPGTGMAAASRRVTRSICSPTASSSTACMGRRAVRVITVAAW